LEKVLSISQLSKRYGKIRALTTVDLDVSAGEIFGILGPNGSGKTTTLSIILDLLKADSGNFQWFGQRSSKETRKRIGSVIESPNFYPYLSAVANLQIIADIKDMGYQDIDRVLTITGLFDRRYSRFKTYSFGMKQRLAIAAALLGNPEVLILDEPTNGLDPQGIADIRDLVLQIGAQGTTIIIASHLLDEVQKICSHVAVLKEGRKLFEGPVSDVLAISDCFEIASDDFQKLKEMVMLHPGYLSSSQSDEIMQVYFSHDVNPGDLNAFCFEKGIILTHLSERKRTLEQHFLALLQETP
jgi:ABC-2 type transport system ATP-binding protein